MQVNQGCFLDDLEFVGFGWECVLGEGEFDNLWAI